MVMMTGMSMLARTTIGPTIFGRICTSTSRGAEAPSTRSASRNGLDFSASVCARATRPKCGISVTAAISTIFPSPGPNSATMASARTRLGKLLMMSKAIRISASARVGR